MIERKVKIVIWDLDDTFWTGTISEEEIVPNTHNINLVKKLVDNGVMNSIVSKNDHAVAEKKLRELGVWDYFIFPHINWQSKGERIKALLNECSLRAENAVFIDDNYLNRKEALFYNPELCVLDPNEISLLDRFAEGQTDIAHKRLAQYKLLEKKAAVSHCYSTNEEFLRQSQIKVYLRKDCVQHFERILDLINRSNQLNYTKKRITADGLREILLDNRYDNGYVEVKDNFGEYGIVGFYSIKNGIAEHFLFSCRTIGMGIEQYVYAIVGFPEVETVEPVRTRLKKNGKIPDWINCNEDNKTADKTVTIDITQRILISGGCDLEQMAAYLHGNKTKITCEFNIGNIRHDHTCLIVGSKKYDINMINEITSNVPFLKRKSFSSECFDPQYGVVVISLLMDYTQAVFLKRDNDDVAISYGDFCKPLSDKNTERYTKEELAWFLNNFDFAGQISPERFRANLQYIREHINKSTALILINGCEIPIDHAFETDRASIHRQYNKIVDDFVCSNDNTYLLDMRKLVVSRDQLTDNIRHYQRDVYYEMAMELTSLINRIAGEQMITAKETITRFKTIANLGHRIKNKIICTWNTWK